MSAGSHRRPRGPERAAVAPEDRTPDLVEAVGAAVAPADVAPQDDRMTPLDHDGVVPVAVLTGLWAVAAVVLLVVRAELVERDLTWWLWTCVAGAGLGLLGFAYCRRRRDAIRAGR